MLGRSLTDDLPDLERNQLWMQVHGGPQPRSPGQGAAMRYRVTPRCNASGQITAPRS
jgi:hypothetical protein